MHEKEVSLPRIAILADDLTGALDSSEPFARAGATVAVATSLEAVPSLPLSESEVVAINLDSRSLDQAGAARAITTAWAHIAAWNPDVLFKKIDSRMKGNVAAELSALIGASGREQVLAAPAIPAIGRVTQAGRVEGFGVDQPIAIADVVGWQPDWEIADCLCEADMANIAARVNSACKSTIAVGASGLAEALASASPFRQAAAPDPLREARGSGRRMLMAIGSRDPITLEQLELLAGSDTPHFVTSGNPPARTKLSAGLIVLRPRPDEQDSVQVARQLARDALQLAVREDLSTILLSGGDTASAFIREAGIERLTPLGLLAPGMPVATGRSGNRRYTLITKSGGFGHPAILRYAAETWQGAANSQQGTLTA